MKTHEKHRKVAPKSVTVYVFTVSSSRFRIKEAKSESGSIIIKMLKDAGLDVSGHRILDDDSKMIVDEVIKSVSSEGVDAVILTGGTGFSKRDLTIEALSPLFGKTMEGFGEIFRYESYRKIGTAAYLSRATAGMISGKPVFCLPGSPEAVELGMRLILPEISHIVFIAKS
ncbi:MAG: MogA/MoaB family molybdenum cofactor biosynthesis protein [Thaumarchaeota archaeon]|nr:MogA/MoaB family molybdenum cofactor biosynthesis protein [Nitrososphaerota archaeon]